MGRGLDRHILPCRAELICRDLGKSGPDALPGLDLGRQPASRGRRSPIFRKGPNTASRRPRAERAALPPRPGEKGDDQPDARSAADQQGAAIDRGKLHPAYCCFERDPVDLAGAEAGKGRLGEDHSRRDLERRQPPVEEFAQSSSLMLLPSRRCRIATGISPSRSSGAPNTAASAMPSQP